MAGHPYQDTYTSSHALIIGIDAYADPQWPSLGNAQKDAQDMHALLIAPPYDFQARLLLGEQATKQAIQRALFGLRKTGADDRLLVYFSGHGYTLTDNFGRETGYLACYDTVLQEDFTALALDEVTGLRAHAVAKHIVFIFDACFSGQALGLTKAATVTAEQFRLRRAYQVLSAGAGDQTVSDWRSMTGYLLPILRDPAGLPTPSGMVTLETLGVYLKQMVTAESGGQQIPQHGQISGSQGGDFIFYEPPPARLIDLLPEKLRRALAGDDPEKRYFAVGEAERLLGDPEIGETVRAVLDELSVNDDDREVRRRAKDALRAAPAPPLGTDLKPGSTFGGYEIIEEISPTSEVEPEPLLASEPPQPTEEAQHPPSGGEVTLILRPAAESDPILGILPRPFRWCEIPSAKQFQFKINGENKGTYDISPFVMAKHPITFEQFQPFVDDPQGFANPVWWEELAADESHSQAPGQQRSTHTQNLPRENVSWYDAVAFCRWLSSKVGYEVRLPTEWEWQWAAQGLDGRQYPWGNEYIQGYANIDEKGSGIQGGAQLKTTTPVGSYRRGASPYGVMDMSGNVWEWCLNEYDDPWRAETTGEAHRVVRGGSWFSLQGYARVSSRHGYVPDYRGNNVGFRVCADRPLTG